jgi:Sec-independent protein translocase protein TatA
MTARELAAILILALAVSLIDGSPAPQATADDKPAADVDQDLLDDLDEFDRELHGANDNAAGEAARAAADDKPASEDTTDDDLLRELDAEEDIPPGGPDAADESASELGEDADPVTRIGEKMRRATRLLEEKTADARAEQLQDEIARDLDQLIKELKRRMNQQSSSSAGQSSQQSKTQQQASRDPIQQPARKPQTKPGGQQSQKPAQDSSERLGQATPKVDLDHLTEVIKEIWGHLPEKDRERLRQLSSEKIMPEHELPVEKYFRRLAEEDEE